MSVRVITVPVHVVCVPRRLSCWMAGDVACGRERVGVVHGVIGRPPSQLVCPPAAAAAAALHNCSTYTVQCPAAGSCLCALSRVGIQRQLDLSYKTEADGKFIQFEELGFD